jgi:hypothetical protein
LLVLSCLGLWAGLVPRAEAAYSLTTGVLTGADEDVREQTPTDTSGGRTFLELRSRNIAGTERHLIGFLRFDLTGVAGPIDAATLRFWIASSQTSSSAFAFDVYGVAEGVANEADWSASTLSYNSAPGLAAADYPNIDRDLAAGEVVYLGAVGYPGGGYSGALSFSNQALLNFLNADSNRKVTLILEPQVAAVGQDFFVHVRAAEGVGSDAGDLAPTLDLPNVTPPGEPPSPPTDGVFLIETSGDVTLGNGLVRGVFTKSNGECANLRFETGTNLLLNGGRLYLDSNSAAPTLHSPAPLLRSWKTPGSACTSSSPAAWANSRRSCTTSWPWARQAFTATSCFGTERATRRPISSRRAWCCAATKTSSPTPSPPSKSPGR